MEDAQSMIMPRAKLLVLGGWSGSGILLIVLLLSELGSVWIGGDSGAFLYVTLHFILLPLFSLLTLVLTIIKALQAKTTQQRIMTLTSVSVPVIVCWTAFTGSTWLTELLRIDFNK